jgi:translation initiation factor 2 beta subunit (eIF-2beta)/eIF-5
MIPHYDGLEDLVQINNMLDKRYAAIIKKMEKQKSEREKAAESSKAKIAEMAKHTLEPPS